MTAARGRRRPAVPPHPLAAVPAATCARQLPTQPFGRSRASDVVHALVDGRPLCRLRVRRVIAWEGAPPLRLCSLCSQGLSAGRLGPAWEPTRAELAELHLHAADQLVAATRERLADIRSAAIYDGSALLAVEQLPTYRASRGVPDSEPVPSLRTAVILGQLLERISPDPVVTSAAEETAQEARDAAAAADRQRMTNRVIAGAQDRRADLRAARQGKGSRR